MALTIDLIKTAKIVDVAEMNIPDCFVKYNKIGTGSGEAKLYAGGSTLKDWHQFFANFAVDCFFTKQDLEKYLEMARFEYENQTQQYRNDISPTWLLYAKELETFPDIIPFTLYHKDYVNKRRFYVQSDEKIYDYFRKIALPIITRLIIQNIEIANEHFIWFRPYISEYGNVFLDTPYDYGNQIIGQMVENQEQTIKTNAVLSMTEKEAIIRARVGQGLFRDNVITKYQKCIITGIDDVRVLIASHIKPWRVSSNADRLSADNGFLLTPTFDRLFDLGFITFKSSGELLVSDYFSDQNSALLNIIKGQKYALRLSMETKTNLEYHRDMVFRH
ncbi:MAG: HNH endonuclease [Clostridiaceae bacterium]|jgi:predicted restriction endonuclease|nr:HNH endonuclease [Clostridiaceae bacterium]